MSDPLLSVPHLVAPTLPSRDEAMLVGTRPGTVLGPGTILKFDRYPVSTEDLQATLPTANELSAAVLNYRQVTGFPIHGVGQATVRSEGVV